MSKPNARRYRLETVKRQYADAVGSPDGRVEFEVGPEDKPAVFSFPHPLFTPDEMQQKLNEAKGDGESARILLGDQLDDFLAAGGDVNSVALLYMGLRTETQDHVQKVRPTKG